MGLLSTFTWAGAASLASGTNCFAHGLPTTPDWAFSIVKTVAGTPACSVPIALVSRGTAALIFENSNGGALNAEGAAQFCHSLIR